MIAAFQEFAVKLGIAPPEGEDIPFSRFRDATFKADSEMVAAEKWTPDVKLGAPLTPPEFSAATVDSLVTAAKERASDAVRGALVGLQNGGSSSSSSGATETTLPGLSNTSNAVKDGIKNHVLETSASASAGRIAAAPLQSRTTELGQLFTPLQRMLTSARLFVCESVRSALCCLGAGVLCGALFIVAREHWERVLRFKWFEKEILRYFHKKNILITGVTSGIGETLAYRLARSPYPPAVLYLHGRRPEQLDTVIARCRELANQQVVASQSQMNDVMKTAGGEQGSGGASSMKIEPILCDLSDPDQVFAVFKRAFKEPSEQETADLAQLLTIPALANDPTFQSVYAAANPNPVDILFNNAGVSQRDELSALDVAPIRHIMNTNSISNMLITKAVLPQLLLSGAKGEKQFIAVAGQRDAQQLSGDPRSSPLTSTAALSSSTRLPDSSSGELQGETGSAENSVALTSSKQANRGVGAPEEGLSSYTSGLHASSSSTPSASSTSLHGPADKTPLQRFWQWTVRRRCGEWYTDSEPMRHSAHIVQVSSFVGRVAFGFRTVYAASKFAGNGFYSSLAAEVWDKNVRIHNVFPGFIATNIAKNALVGKGEAFGVSDAKIENGLPPEEVVNRMLAGVYFEDSEIEVLNTWWMRVQALLSRWSGAMHRYFALTNYRDQVRMAEEARAKEASMKREKSPSKRTGRATVSCSETGGIASSSSLSSGDGSSSGPLHGTRRRSVDMRGGNEGKRAGSTDMVPPSVNASEDDDTSRKPGEAGPLMFYIAGSESEITTD
ncbi:unnamed protein product [Amoebophrya sp. A25]|nr:unnamed protein product [Amoebophrya sp. A25]|eukprot:GSA25T00005613001.1